MKLLAIIFCLLSTHAFSETWEYRVSNDLDSLNLRRWEIYPVKNPIRREFEGFIEYRVFFQKSALSNSSGIYLGKIGDADKTFLNDHQIGQTGNFPPYYAYNMDTERTYYLPDHLLREGRNELRILVYSKFLVNKGFNPDNFKIANIHVIDTIRYNDGLLNNLSKIIVPILCLVLTAVSFPLLAPKHLWNNQVMIFLIGLSSFILGLCRGRLGYHFFDMLAVYKLTLISSVVTIWLVAIFMTKNCKSSLRFFPTLISACLITSIITSPELSNAASWGRIWFHISPVFLLVALYGNYKSGHLSALRSTGLVFLFLTNVNDNLNDLRIVSTTPLMQLGLGIFIALMIFDQILGLKRSWARFFMKEAQLEIDAAIGKQALQIAHDLRSPIESLNVGLNQLKNVPKNEEQNLRIALKRIHEVCDSLLGKTNKVELVLPSEVDEAIASVVEELRALNNKNVNLIYSSHNLKAHLDFEIDVCQLKRTICNLVTNAIEASPENGQVIVKTWTEDNFIKVCIHDNGIGFHNFTDEVFERGYTTKPTGNGFGLSGAKSFVENLGGKISISRLLDGTEVKLMIPASLTEELTARTEASSVVLIDDDPLVRFNWKRQGQKANITVDAFESYAVFLSNKDRFNYDTPIYIDSNLGSEKGELLSENLFKMGFKDIVLTTGAPRRSIQNTNWISSIVGKSFEGAVIRKDQTFF